MSPSSLLEINAEHENISDWYVATNRVKLIIHVLMYMNND